MRRQRIPVEGCLTILDAAQSAERVVELPIRCGLRGMPRAGLSSRSCAQSPEAHCHWTECDLVLIRCSRIRGAFRLEINEGISDG
jgi:hypothetical protein